MYFESPLKVYHLKILVKKSWAELLRVFIYGMFSIFNDDKSKKKIKIMFHVFHEFEFCIPRPGGLHRRERNSAFFQVPQLIYVTVHLGYLGTWHFLEYDVIGYFSERDVMGGRGLDLQTLDLEVGSRVLWENPNLGNIIRNWKEKIDRNLSY